MEVVSDEEMALIDAALAAAAAGARPLVSSTARRTAAQLSCAAYSAAGGDIEDSPVPRRSLLARFRERRALAITDITATVTTSPTPKARAPLAFPCLLGRGGQTCSHRVVLTVRALLAAGMVRETDGVRARTRQAGEDRGHEGRFGTPCAARASGESYISGSPKRNAASLHWFYLKCLLLIIVPLPEAANIISFLPRLCHGEFL